MVQRGIAVRAFLAFQAVLVWRVTLSAADSPDQADEKLLSLDTIDDRMQLTQWISQGVVRSVHTNEATLEEVFLKVAGTSLV